MGIFIGVVWILLELLLLIFLLTKIKRYRSLTIKDTIVYPLLLVLTLLLLTFSRMLYIPDSGFVDSIKVSFTDALNIVKLSINKDLAAILKENSFPLFIAYYGALVISFAALASLTLYCVDIAIKNIIRLAKSFFSGKEVIRIFGFTEEAKRMMRNFKDEKVKMTFVLNSGVLNKYVEEKTFLDRNKIGYVDAPYQLKNDYVKAIKKVTKLRNKKYTIITFFEEDLKNDTFSSAIIDYLKNPKTNRGNVRFIMNVNHVQEEFIKRKHHDENGKDTLKGQLRTYNKFNLNAYLFIKEHTFSKYLNILNEKEGGFINEDCTLGNVDIHAYFLGFGKINQPLMRDVLINNQFVKKVSAGKGLYKLEPYQIKVDVYDDARRIKALDLSNGLLKYHQKDFNQKDYLSLPHDYISNFTFHPRTNIEEANFINEIYDGIKERIKTNKQKQVNFFFVSLDSDMYDCLIAEKVRKQLISIKDSYNFFFVRKEMLTKDDKEDENFKFMGNDNVLFSTQNVLLDNIFASAKKEHYYYLKKDEEVNIDEEWNKLSCVKQKSNVYAIAGLYFKKDLLNCNKANYEEKYNPKGLKPVNDNDIDRLIKPSKTFEAMDVLAFSEHERWNAFELAQGVLPMKKSLFLELNKGLAKGEYATNKTSDGNYHFCITSQKGLVEYYDLYQKHGYNDANVIAYDYDLMDHYIEHFDTLNA